MFSLSALFWFAANVMFYLAKSNGRNTHYNQTRNPLSAVDIVLQSHFPFTSTVTNPSQLHHLLHVETERQRCDTHTYMGSKDDAEDEELLTNPSTGRKIFWSTECVISTSREGYCVVCHTQEPGWVGWSMSIFNDENCITMCVFIYKSLLFFFVFFVFKFASSISISNLAFRGF